jgi:hypothetical protein
MVLAKVLLACGLLASCALGQGQMDSQGNMGAQTETSEIILRNAPRCLCTAVHEPTALVSRHSALSSFDSAFALPTPCCPCH